VPSDDAASWPVWCVVMHLLDGLNAQKHRIRSSHVCVYPVV
jgi:hypothetical protein